MEIYRLTASGRALARSRRNKRTPAWEVIHFLNRQGSATREQITNYISGADAGTIYSLKSRGIIETGV